jgi:hypothetical protein
LSLDLGLKQGIEEFWLKKFVLFEFFLFLPAEPPPESLRRGGLSPATMNIHRLFFITKNMKRDERGRESGRKREKKI